MLTHWVLLLPVVAVLLLQRAAANTIAEHQLQAADPRSFALDPNSLQHLQPDDGYPDSDGIRRFECPAGFFRLRRNCYYLSGGTASWREAHFQCTARNATLAVLNRYGKDKILRKYLMGEQFRRLERWIGGMYNWRQMNWDWGVSGDKVLFQNFGNPDMMASKNHSWQHYCMVLDPQQQYKWNARSCVEHKYFICEVAAGRIGKSRKRKNISDPLAPQNQRLRPTKKDEYKHKVELSQRRRKNKLKSMRKKNWHPHEDNQVWAHGIKLGSRPPKGSYRSSPKWQKLGPNSYSAKGPRHGHKYGPMRPEPRISQVTPGAGEYGAFPADGRVRADERLQSLGSDFTREEILLKI